MLRAEHLVKRYRGRAVVHDVSLEVHRGEVVGLLGPNGAGKTTCLYMVVGLVAADGGKISLDEHNLTRANMHRRARLGLGYLPQEASIFRRLSVQDNIDAILELRKDLDREKRKQELGRLLDEFNVSHLADQMGVSLSGGERRRVEIARALAADPRFILEPHFQRFAPGVLRQSLGYCGGEVFLKASCASGSDLGCCGRTERRRKPKAANCLPTVRSCMTTPNSASILRFRSMRRHRTTPSLARSGLTRTQWAKVAFCSGVIRGTRPLDRQLDSPSGPSAL
jgi:ABC-type branched-subunit amino acid transport system ATPase component